MSIAETGQHIQVVETKQLQCLKCGHVWLPRDPKKLPRVCPKCKSRQYDKPKVPNVGRKPRRKVDTEQVGSE